MSEENTMGMSVRQLGTGEHAVVCLNGWFGHGGDWGPWEQCLDVDKFTWLFPDYRGYGTRKEESGNFSIEEVSDDLTEFIEGLSGFKSVSILGHSMGGVFAQHALLKLEGKIQAFIGVSSVSASGTPMPEEQRSLFESAGTEVSSRKTIIDITTGNRLSDKWLERMALSSKEHSTDEAVGKYFRAWADCNFLADMREQGIPALVIVGAHDPAVTAAQVRESYGISFPNLSIYEFEDAGHYAMFEAPVRLATEIESFLREVVVDA